MPAPASHARNSSCIYDVGQTPLRLKVVVPDGVCWSGTFHGRSQVCFFTLNDIEAWRRHGSDAEIVLTRPEGEHRAVGDEIVVEAPRWSRIGLILVRRFVLDPLDAGHLDEVGRVQGRAFVEPVA